MITNTTDQLRIQQIGNNSEQLPRNPPGHVNRLSERKSTAIKQPLWRPSRKDAYVSDIVNVQSLLNLRSLELQKPTRQNNSSFQDRIIINVCGDRYETHRTTLELYPDSLLGNRRRRKYYYDKTRHEYFFDRNRACFEAILYYYQSNGRLRRPTYVPLDIFLEEVTFFQLGQEALDQLRKDENIKEVKKIHLPKNRFQRYVWTTLEYPQYSTLAKIVSIVSLLMILISAIALAIESLPQYNNGDEVICDKELDTLNDSLNNTVNTTNATLTDLHKRVHICSRFFQTPFFIIQSICVGFFTIELVLRIISAPSLFGYIKNILNWIDVLAVVPYYLIIGIHLSGHQHDVYSTAYDGLRFLRIVRFIRILKIYRVFRNIKSLRVLASTLKQSIPDFLIMIIILTLLSFLFGVAAYFAENEANRLAFDSIPKAVYWGLMTITSVGYGDIAPITPTGRAIACLCALFGAATIGMLVSVLVDRYQRVFARKLYINEEIIDFHDHSDDENNDTSSKGSSGQLHRPITKEIEDPDARAKENAAFERDIEVTDIIPSVDTQDIGDNPISRLSSRAHFIIGYVDNDEHITSQDLIQTISAAVARRQNSGENIQLNVVPNVQERQQSSPYDVRFRLSMSSEEEDDDDDNEAFTEIVSGCGSKGNVLRKFQSPPSPNGNKPDKHV